MISFFISINKLRRKINMPHLNSSKIIERLKEQANRFQRTRPFTSASEIIKQKKAQTVYSYTRNKTNNPAQTPAGNVCGGDGTGNNGTLTREEQQNKGKNNVVSQLKSAVQEVNTTVYQSYKNPNTNNDDERRLSVAGGNICNGQSTASRIALLEPCQTYDYSNLNPVKGVRPCCNDSIPRSAKNVVGGNSCCD